MLATRPTSTCGGQVYERNNDGFLHCGPLPAGAADWLVRLGFQSVVPRSRGHANEESTGDIWRPISASGQRSVTHTLNLQLNTDELAYISRHAGGRSLMVDDVLLRFLASADEQFEYPNLDENRAAAMCFSLGAILRQTFFVRIVRWFALAATDTFSISQDDTVLPACSRFTREWRAQSWPFRGSNCGAEGLLDSIQQERATIETCKLELGIRG
jgi:hypothetical protein